ncbi:hypothetical protein ABVT39_027108, partial [Epinephelus coioides]
VGLQTNFQAELQAFHGSHTSALPAPPFHLPHKLSLTPDRSSSPSTRVKNRGCHWRCRACTFSTCSQRPIAASSRRSLLHAIAFSTSQSKPDIRDQAADSLQRKKEFPPTVATQLGSNASSLNTTST